MTSTPVAVLTAVVMAASVGLLVQYASTKRAAEQSVPTAAAVAASNASTMASASTAAGPMAASAAQTTKSSMWAASAPGRVEPKSGDVRIGSQVPGRIAEVLVSMNDRVVTGDLLVRIDDDEAQARLVAAEAEAAVRKRERDAETIGRLAQDRRNAEDAVAVADRALFQARRDLDRVIVGRRAATPTASDDDVVKARTVVATAKDKAEQERASLRRVQVTANMPLPTRLESGLATARSDLLLAETAIERARVRAASEGTVLQVNAKVGENAAPSPELALIVMGDLTGLRVRAELEERDVSKVRIGQKVVVRSDAYPGRDFKGTVSTMAQSLAPPRLASRGPRRPNDVDTLEVLVDIEGATTLLPGMRADVFFVPDATVQSTPVTKSN